MLDRWIEFNTFFYGGWLGHGLILPLRVGGKGLALLHIALGVQHFFRKRELEWAQSLAIFPIPGRYRETGLWR